MLVFYVCVVYTTSGGQFLRAYVERHNDPPIHNLITFGSQHMGVADIPPCKPFDVLCQIARNAARAGAYNEWAQQNLVQVRALHPSLLNHSKANPSPFFCTGAVFPRPCAAPEVPRREPLPYLDQQRGARDAERDVRRASRAAR